MKTKIIGFCGKKQSGKDTACNYIMANELKRAGVCRNAGLDKQGNIIVTDIFGERVGDLERVPLIPEYVMTDALFHDFTFCKKYALAD